MLLDPSHTSIDELAVAMELRRAAVMERESALQVSARVEMGRKPYVFESAASELLADMVMVMLQQIVHPEMLSDSITTALPYVWHCAY